MSQIATHWPRRHRLSVADYCRMAEVGILGPDDHTELIDGEIIDMPPPGSLHAGTVDLLIEQFRSAVGKAAIVRAQNPINLGVFSQPQPDLALLRRRPDYYRSAQPGACDVLLVVEVADSSLRYDRDTKIALYAQHDIPEVWLVDVRAKQLTRYCEPEQGAYTRTDNPDVRLPLDIRMLIGTTVELGGLFSDD